MYTLQHAETLPLTRDLIMTFATMTPSPTERPLSERRVKYLQDCLATQRFGPCHWVSVYLGGTRFRMNGQHSSTMLAKVPDPLPEGLYVHVDDYEAETPEDMALLFRQFDAKESSRSRADIAGAYQNTYPELVGVPRASAKLAIEAIAWYRRVIEGVPSGTGDDRYELFRQTVHHEFLHWFGGLMDMKTPEFKKTTIVAAMYATELANQEASRAFWEEVGRGGNPYEDNHPTTVLDKWLKLCKEGQCEDKMKEAYHYQGCVYAWNAYREDKKIKDIRFSTSKGLLFPHE